MLKKGFIAFIVLVVAINFAYTIPTDEQIRQAANSLGVPFIDLKQFVESYQTKSTSTDAIQIQAWKLSSEFTTNQLRATNTYSNKLLQITGTVQELRQSSGQYFIEIKGVKHLYFISVYFKQSELSKLANINPGATITVVGKFKEFDGYDVWIEDAYLSN
jgi:hypothetical protein